MVDKLRSSTPQVHLKPLEPGAAPPRPAKERSRHPLLNNLSQRSAQSSAPKESLAAMPSRRAITADTSVRAKKQAAVPSSQPVTSHSENDALAERMVREMLNEIPLGKLGRELNPGLLDSVHSLAYEKDAKYETLQGKLTPGYLLAWARGKHSIQPAEKRESWAAAPGGVEMRAFDHQQIVNVRSYGASFAGVPIPGRDGGGTRLVGKTLFRDASGINNDLVTLCKEVKSLIAQNFGSTVPLEGARVAAYFKQHFIAIHPYMDANGRVSRLVAERILKEFQLPAPDWHGKVYALDLSVEEAARLMLGMPKAAGNAENDATLTRRELLA